ncbi:hypothetical protein [Miltoncostaea oceani]|uniref:hypothetical protein n=1 Tax=Miltoncostaea oceani TaxID=2843216 RepID=UPI001C3C969A|nr:hypothetical protein [Miltoncostaea oceani]
MDDESYIESLRQLGPMTREQVDRFAGDMARSSYFRQHVSALAARQGTAIREHGDEPVLASCNLEAVLGIEMASHLRARLILHLEDIDKLAFCDREGLLAEARFIRGE